MKIKITQLRKTIRELFKEEWSKTHIEPHTIPAASSRDEQEMQKDLAGRKWGSTELRLPKPSEHGKAGRVFSIIAKSGTLAGMSQDKRVEFKKEFDAWFDAKSPEDKLISTAEELAEEFAARQS